MGPKQSADSEPNWPSCSAGLALEESCAVFLDESGIGGLTLFTEDEGLDVTDQFFLDSLWRNSTLEHHTNLFARARGSQLVDEVLVDVIWVAVHRINNSCEVPEDGLTSFDKNLGRRHCPAIALTDVLRDSIARSVEQSIVFEVGHWVGRAAPPFSPHRAASPARTNRQSPVSRPVSMDEDIEVKVARVHSDAQLPTRGSVHAAGWDLYALEDTEVLYRNATLVRTGLHVAIPVGYEGQVRARSSLGKRGLIPPHGIGTIDADYRGELFVMMTWIGEGDSYTITKGERIAQLLITPIPRSSFKEVAFEELGETDRGQGGFGSTGRF